MLKLVWLLFLNETNHLRLLMFPLLLDLNSYVVITNNLPRGKLNQKDRTEHIVRDDVVEGKSCF